MATRLYLASTGTPEPNLSPAFAANWDDTSIGARLPMRTAKAGSVMTTVSFSDSDDTLKDILFRQYISDPLVAVTITNPAVKFQIRASESSADNNLDTLLHVRVVQPDGSLRGTILSFKPSSGELSTSLVNRGIAHTASATTIVAQDMDRLVIEIGTQGNPSVGGSHSSSLRIGDVAGADLPENETETADYNPWFEISTNLAFIPSFGWFQQQPEEVFKRKPQTQTGMFVNDLTPIAPPPGRETPARFGPEVIIMPPRIVSL